MKKTGYLCVTVQGHRNKGNGGVQRWKRVTYGEGWR